MTRLDDLPPDQRAALSLLLRQRKSYAEVAGLLRIPEHAVHDRAHAALAVLAPRLARELPAGRREEIGDHLLGQQSDLAARLRTSAFFEGSPQGRAWALAISAELAPLASAPLPAIPAPGSPTPAPDTRESRPPASSPRTSPGRTGGPAAPPTASSGRPVDSAGPPPSSQGSPSLDFSGSLPSSRLGGAVLLAALAAVIFVAVLLLTNGGGSHRAAHPSTPASTATGTGTTGTTGTTAKASTPTEDKRIALTSPNPASRALGAAEVLSEGSKFAFYLAAEHLAPSNGFFYAVWLSSSPTSFQALGKSPPVGADGKLQGGALLPADAAKFHTILLTHETNPRPTHPGPTVLTGAFALH